jgi:flagellin
MIERLCPAAAAETSPFSRQGGRLSGKREGTGPDHPGAGRQRGKTFIKEDEKMRINHNISALNAWRALGQTDNAMTKSLERLSSGLRINRAADDAAGLAISEKMRGQIRGLNQAIRNAQDAISLIQTAEGALNETHSILQRMRELAVQAATDTNTDEDRQAIQEEINQLAAELTRIAIQRNLTQDTLDGTF